MSDPAPVSESLQTWLLKQRHEDLTKIFCTAWDLYVKFYTVFLTFSLGAMGWILSRSGNDKLPKNVIHIVAWAFVIQSLLTGATSAFMAFYSRKVANDHASLENTMMYPETRSHALDQTQTIPTELATWAGVANATGMLTMIIIWCHFAFS